MAPMHACGLLHTTASQGWRAQRIRRFRRLLSSSSNEGLPPGAITYAYDADGNVITKTAPLPNQTAEHRLSQPATRMTN